MRLLLSTQVHTYLPNPSGYNIADINQFSKRFYRLYNSALGISRDAPIEEYEVELEDEGGTSIIIFL